MSSRTLYAVGDLIEGRGAVPLAVTKRSGFAWRDRRSFSFAVAGVAMLVGINVLVYVLPIDYRSFGDLAYLGVFLVTFIANAATFFPVPYIPIFAHVAQTAQHVWLVVVLGALASVLGESVAYAVGRTQEHAVEDHRAYRWLHRWLGQPLRAGIALFLLAVPLNPLFDVAGLAAGALGVRYWIFLVSVFVGRIVRLAVVAWIGIAGGFGG